MTDYGPQQAHVFHWQATLPYLVYLPEGYGEDTAKRWPLVLFLHGAGERGNGGDELQKVVGHGLPRLVKEGKQFPFIMVSPQCPPDGWWPIQVLGRLLDEIERSYAVDSERIYVTGLSMGGAGTWALAIAQPQRFAAIAPICGRGDASRVCAIKDVSVWNFHGAKDSVVPLQCSEDMVNALRACGSNVRYTVYPDADHDSWTETYNNPELYSWLLSHRKGTASTGERV